MRARGFTLVELMVALSGGLFLSIVVFALARDTTRFYQREGRISSATLAGIIGFERLKADIERAGYLSTPNIQADPLVCSRVDSSSPEGLRTLAGVRITADTPDLSGNPAFAFNSSAGQDIKPDQLLLSGSYSATDEFPISQASNGTNIFLQVNTPSMARIGYTTASGTNNQLALLQNVFGAAPGQILRVKDQAGMLYFGQIASVTAGSQPSVTLTAPFPVQAAGGRTCGLRGFEMGSSANVVNLVRYRIMKLKGTTDGASWAPLFTASSGASGEDDRTELVRDQLMADGQTTIPGTVDIAAEYAVDLEFSVMGQLVKGVSSLAPASAPGSDWDTYFKGNATDDRPQGVRAVRVKLSVRSREADRTTNIAGGLYRFRVGTNEWARVRTFQADVALPNQRRVQW
jgi:Tfp pilus assembly protein PilW